MGSDNSSPMPKSHSRMSSCTLTAFVLVLCGLAFQTGMLIQCQSNLAPMLAESPSYELAKRESNGFFTDIIDSEWIALREKVASVYPNTLEGLQPSQLRNTVIHGHKFFQNHFEPDFNCRHERRIGRLGDGGKWVCDPHRIQKQPDCLVYSVGSNGDPSFEQSVRDEIGTHCEIHTFDMGDYASRVEPTGSHYHRWGISGEAFTDDKGQIYKTLQQTVQELGHQGRTIDIFKIDCEGCEWSSFPSFFESDANLRQILIELHVAGGGMMPVPSSMDFFDAMYHHGYVITHKEVNILAVGGCIEYAFLKLDSSFFSGIEALASPDTFNNGGVTLTTK